MREIENKLVQPKADEIEDRHKLGVRRVKRWSRDEQPAFERVKVRGTKQCKFCGKPTKDPMLVCAICRNCQVCGGFNPSYDPDRCGQCGRFQDVKRPKPKAFEITAERRSKGPGRGVSVNRRLAS